MHFLIDLAHKCPGCGNCYHDSNWMDSLSNKNSLNSRLAPDPANHFQVQCDSQAHYNAHAQKM
jgi:hypothetical protein